MQVEPSQKSVRSLKKAFSRPAISRITRAIFGLALGFFFLFLALREVDWSVVANTISQVKIGFLLLGLVVSVTTLMLKSYRWKYQLESCNRLINFIDVSAAFISAQLLNSLFPIRIGEVSRVYVVSQRGVEPACAVGTVLGEKFIDILAFILLIGIMLLKVPLPEWLKLTVSMLSLVFLLASLILIILLLFPSQLNKLVEKISMRLSRRMADFVQRHTRAGFASLAVFRTPNKLGWLLAQTAVIWGTAILTNLIALLALGLPASIDVALFSLILIQVGYSLPGLPGKVGVFEYAGVLAFEFFGWDRSAGLSYGILLHVIAYLPVVVLGLLSFWHLQASGLRRTPPGGNMEVSI